MRKKSLKNIVKTAFQKKNILPYEVSGPSIIPRTTWSRFIVAFNVATAWEWVKPHKLVPSTDKRISPFCNWKMKNNILIHYLTVNWQIGHCKLVQYLTEVHYLAIYYSPSSTVQTYRTGIVIPMSIWTWTLFLVFLFWNT